MAKTNSATPAGTNVIAFSRAPQTPTKPKSRRSAMMADVAQRLAEREAIKKACGIDDTEFREWMSSGPAGMRLAITEQAMHGFIAEFAMLQFRAADGARVLVERARRSSVKGMKGARR